MNKASHLLFLVLVALGLTFLSFKVMAQSQPITLHVENARLEVVLEELQKQSGMDFVYEKELVRSIGGITLNVAGEPLNAVLDKIFAPLELHHEFMDTQVLITRKELSITGKTQIVKGIVRNEHGNIMPGVTIVVKGTLIGAATDVKGEFSLEIPTSVRVLRFSFVGMKTVEMAIPSGKQFMEVIMQTQNDELNEVVVTGFLQTTKRKATGSVAVVPMAVFNNKAQVGVDQLLQGQIAGVSVQALSGRPGETAKIRIRGTSTLTGDADPLWVIDGVPMQQNTPTISAGQIKSGDFNDIFVNGIGGINPNDIENVTILKDASATAIYGSRASGGVIVVTTKRGKQGKIRVNYAANVSVGLKPQRDIKLMNSTEKLAWEQELWDEFSAKGFEDGKYYPVVGIVGMLRAGVLTRRDGKIAIREEGESALSQEEQNSYIQDLSGRTTNWFDELFRNTISTSHHISLSGGTEKNTYYLSVGYSQDNGLIKVNDFKRYNVTSNITLTPNERFDIGFGLDFSKREANDYVRKLDPFEYAYYANPYERPYNDDGSYRGDFTYYTLGSANGFPEKDLDCPKEGFNIIREMKENPSVAENVSTSLRFNLDVNILPQLKFSGLASFAFTHNETDDILGENTFTAFNDRLSFDLHRNDKQYGSITQTAGKNTSYSVRGMLTYNGCFRESHSLTLLGGVELRREKLKSIYAKRYGYDPVTGNSSMPYPDKLDTSVFASIIDELSGQQIDENKFASFFASVDYYLLDRYVFSASFRTDGSNHFGSDEQFNPTWSAGIAWHMGDEGFMTALKPTLNRLTWRLAMGYTGNVNPYAYPEIVMDYTGDYRKADGGTSYRIGKVYVAPNPRLRWEKTRDMKIALDFGLWDERFSGLVEAYYRLTTDAVTTSRILSSTGFTSQKYNTSEIENSGIEATLRWSVIRSSNLNLNLSANIAYNQNTLKKYRPLGGTISGGYTNFEGYPMDAVFGGKSMGIDPYDGIYKFQLRDDAIIQTATDLNEPDNYLFYIGTATAPYTGGFNLNCNYKGFSINVGGSFALKATIYNNMDSPASYASAQKGSGEVPQSQYSDLYANHLNVYKDAIERWTPDRTTGVKYPRITDYFGTPLNLNYYNPFNTNIVRGIMTENTSYLRVSDITLGYEFPAAFLKRAGLSSLSVKMTLNNFFTFTSYTGLDPETPGATYPKTRSVTLGLNLAF